MRKIQRKEVMLWSTRGFRVWLLSLIPLVSALTLIGCAARSPDPVHGSQAGRVEYQDSLYIQQEWARALADLHQGRLHDGLKRTNSLKFGFPLYPRLAAGSLRSITELDPRKLRFLKQAGLFTCGSMKQKVLGCFIPMTVGPNLIYFYADFPGTVYHESVHAILYAIQDWRWSCSLHDYNFNGEWDCYE